MTCSKSLRVKVVIFASGQTMSGGGGGSHAETPPQPDVWTLQGDSHATFGLPHLGLPDEIRVLLH